MSFNKHPHSNSTTTKGANIVVSGNFLILYTFPDDIFEELLKIFIVWSLMHSSMAIHFVPSKNFDPEQEDNQKVPWKSSLKTLESLYFIILSTTIVIERNTLIYITTRTHKSLQ